MSLATNQKSASPHTVNECSAQTGGSRYNRPLLHSDLSFFFPVNGTLLATVDTPPATAETPPFTRPTPTEGTAVTADLVISKLFPPSQATPPTVAPTTPFVALKRPPVTRQIMVGGATGCSLPPVAAKKLTVIHLINVF